MSDFTIKNLEEIEDSALSGGYSPPLEMHYATRVLGCGKSGISLQGVAANASAPFGHHHDEEEEIYVIVSGSGEVILDGKAHSVKQWDAIRVAPKVTRSFNGGSEGIRFIAFGAPGLGNADASMVSVE